MKRIATECDHSPLWVLHTLARRGLIENMDQLLTFPNHYSVKEDGIMSSAQNQQGVKVPLKFLPQKWMFEHNKYRIIRAAVSAMVIDVFADKVPCCMYSPGGPHEWYFELHLDVSSLKNQAMYCVRAWSHYHADVPRRSRASLEIDLFATGLDEKVVGRVKMVDEALDELLTERVAWARKI